MITFIIDNGLRYSSHALYFVEAPDDFGAWIMTVLVPWLKRASLKGEELVVRGACNKVRRLSLNMSTMTYQFFLADSLIVGDYDYNQSPPEHRPLYRGA